MMEYLEMGGYAGFIWPSYGVVAAVMIGLYIISRRELTAAQRAQTALDGSED